MLTTWSPFSRIGRPLEAHNVRSPEAYRLWHEDAIRTNRAARPALAWGEPELLDVAVVAIVSGGRWVVRCARCANAPSYDPEWQLACCIDCGAVYTVAPPASWQRGEMLLMQRPRMQNRHWDPVVESIEDLARENDEHALHE